MAVPETKTVDTGRAGNLILDGADNVVGGDPQIIDYHLRHGGEEGGCLALPGLLQLAALARVFGMKLHRKVRFVSGHQDVSAWASVHPGAPETIIQLSHIISQQRPATIGPIPSQFTLRLTAQAWLHVDAEQQISAAHISPHLPADMPDMVDIISKMPGKHWGEALRPAADDDLIALYDRGQWPAWQLLDGAVMALKDDLLQSSGPQLQWIVRIFPIENSALSEWLLLPAEGLALLAKDSAVDGSATGGAASANAAIKNPPPRLFSDSVAPALLGPVGRIMANAQTIRDRSNGPLRQDYVSYAGNIADAAEHLLGLIEDASALEEVDNPRETLDIHALDLVDVARRACGLLAMKASARNIRIDCPQEDEVVMCKGDFRRILQIVLNLLGNAIRYSPEASMIWLRAEEDGDVSRLIVSDQGNGLSKKQQAKIFNKFERLGRSDDGGSGLGLYIARRLARAMQGDIIIDSAPGQGARFIVELPSAQSEKQH